MLRCLRWLDSYLALPGPRFRPSVTQNDLLASLLGGGATLNTVKPCLRRTANVFLQFAWLIEIFFIQASFRLTCTDAGTHTRTHALAGNTSKPAIVIFE